MVNKEGRGSKCEGNGRINHHQQQQKNKRKEKKNTIIQVSDIKYLCLLPSFVLSPPLMQQEETFISMPTGLYMECPHHRNTQTYTGPESNQAKNVDLATGKS